MKTTTRQALGMLVIGLFGMGCSNSVAPPKPIATQAVAHEEDEHDHGEGPHGGTILEFGKYHGEFCMDHAKKQATVYILDGKAKNTKSIPVEKLSLSIKSPQFQTDLVAMPQDGEPKGESSRFVATHENFGKEQEFEGTVSAVINGKPYLGDFKEEAHDHDKKKK